MGLRRDMACLKGGAYVALEVIQLEVTQFRLREQTVHFVGAQQRNSFSVFVVQTSSRRWSLFLSSIVEPTRSELCSPTPYITHTRVHTFEKYIF